MEKLIEVTHVNGSWRLTAGSQVEPTLFLSGGRAEQAAHRLARCFAEMGCDTRIQVRDKQDLVVGAHHYFGG